MVEKPIHWGALVGFLAAIIGIGVAAFFVTRFVRGPYQEGTLRQDFVSDWVSSYALCIAVCVTLIVLFSNIWGKQLLSAASIILMFGGLGGGCLWRSQKHKAFISKSDIIITYVFREKAIIYWKDVKSIRYGFMGINFEVINKNSASIPKYWQNVHYLIECAADNGVPCYGFDD